MASEEQIYDQPAYSQHVLELLRLGHEYCLFIEKSDDQSLNELINFIHKILPMLYLKGLFLPNIQVDTEDSGERFVTEEEWEKVFNNLRNVLKEKDQFWTIDPEISGGNEPVKLSLAENMTDIYQDLKDFIMQYQKNSRQAKEIAVHECKSWFFDRWGKRISETNHYLHHLTFGSKSENTYQDLF
jgi:hypothetical protein